MPEAPTTTYRIDGMDCADCAVTIQNGVARLAGVRHVSVDFITTRMQVDGDAPAQAIRQRVEALGYRLADNSPAPPSEPNLAIGFGRYLLRRRDTRLALAGGALILAALASQALGAPAAASQAILLAALMVAGYPIARSGLTALIVNRDFNINLLMSIAAVGAVIIGEPAEAATLIFLFAVAEALEGYTADRARDSLRRLMELAPALAIRLDGEREARVPVEALRVGDRLLVPPGERIPMDGRVTQGASDVNQAPITGESLPVRKAEGAEVFAGSVNGQGALIVRVTHLAGDNMLSRIIQLVEEAQAARAPAQRFIDRFARIYTPAMVAAAALVAAVPPLVFGQPFFDTPDGAHGWLYRALALLVIACPCALVISAPVTMVSALTAAARRGVLVKGGAHLEALARVRAVAFDKTGTLTRGELVVSHYRSVDCENGEACAACDDVLALAASLERRSAHPLARAVVAAAEQRGLADVYPAAESVEALAGRGVQGRVNGKLATLGSHRLFDEDHPHAAQVCDWIEAAEARGHTSLLVCDGDRVRGYVSLADEVRADGRAALADLRSLGLATVMLTGDNAAVAQAVGAAMGVGEVRSSLMPAEKLAAIH